MSEDPKESEIKVTDKRRYRGGAETTPPDQATPPEPIAEEKIDETPPNPVDMHEDHDSTPLPEVSFMSLIFSLATSAMMGMGDLADQDGKSHKDLRMAKQTIDLLGLLSEKTKGNLTTEEEQFLSQTLRDLRLRFVQARG